MSSRKNILSLITLAAAVFFSTAIVNAQDAATTTPADKEKVEKRERGFRGDHDKMGRGEFGGRHGGHRGMGRGGFGMLRGIELTEAQKTQLKSIMETNKPDQARRDQMKAFMEAKRAGTVTDDQKAQMKAFHEEMQAKRQSLKAQIDGILTAEQKQQLETRKTEMKQRREERRQRWQERKQQTPATTETPKTTKDN